MIGLRVLNNLQATNDALSTHNRGNMVETYKTKYDSALSSNTKFNCITVSPTLTTRGNNLRLQKNRADMMFAVFLTNRIVNMWNSTDCLMTLCMQNLLHI